MPYFGRSLTGLTTILLLWILAACNSYKNKLPPSTAIDTKVLSFATINDAIFKPSCAECHAGSSARLGISFSTYDELLASKTVVPFDPLASQFYTSVASGRMPQGRPPLSTEQIQALFDWIKNGA